MKSIAGLLVVVVAGGLLGIAAGANSTGKKQDARQKQDIVETAVSAGTLNTLAAALEAAGLVPALQGEGPFTVFAPTDEAFAKLPQGTVESLLKPENKEQLKASLTYHVVAGKVPAEKVVSLNGAKTLNGQRVDIRVADGKVQVDDANVVKADVHSANGIIHVIDRVMMPSQNDIVATAKEAGKFETLLAAVKAAGLLEALSSEEALTIFAPTDQAFAKLPEGTVESLLKPENKERLKAILTYHVVPGRVYSEGALEAGRLTTLHGSSLRVSSSNGKAMVNDANLVAANVDAANGVVHVVDAVLLPPAGK